MKPIERPCVPPAVLAEAGRAERRRDRALERLTTRLADALPDAFEQALRAVIDADRAAVELIEKRKPG